MSCGTQPEDTPGTKALTVKGVEFRISFVEDKDPTPEAQPLKAKEFALYSAGIYDNEAVKRMPWADIRPFVLKLFQVRDTLHQGSLLRWLCRSSFSFRLELSGLPESHD